MQGPPFDGSLEIVRGGGLTLLTADVFVKAAVHRCSELAAENDELRRRLQAMQHAEVARYRTLRRDVSQIKRTLAQEKTIGAAK